MADLCPLRSFPARGAFPGTGGLTVARGACAGTISGPLATGQNVVVALD
jgi:hypothetical protein